MAGPPLIPLDPDDADLIRRLSVLDLRALLTAVDEIGWATARVEVLNTFARRPEYRKQEEEPWIDP